jgi:hypothetical protein
VAAQIVNYPPDRCLCCRKPIVVGQKWTELVNDNGRARFHVDCAPVWRTQQEVAARRALNLVGLVHFFKRPANAPITRQSLAAIG